MTAGRRMLLRAAAGALPGPPVDNAALQARLGLSAEWVDRFVGTRTRHFAEGTADLAGLCTRAADTALASAGLGAGQLDFVVLATATPDALMPTTAAVVADRLGISGVPVYQLQSGCSGTVQALALAEALLRTGARHGLVLGGDLCTRHRELDRDFRRMPPAELVNHVLFGDGAGAAVVSAEPGPGAALCRAVRHRPVRPGQPPGQLLEWYGAAGQGGDARPPVSEDYRAVRQLVPELARQEGKDLLGALDWSGSDLDYLLPPQLGGLMTERITAGLREALGADRAVELSCVAATGNTGNALLLFQLELLLQRLAPGDRALALCVESSHWIAAGLALEAV
ncbi:3-oxoacyl-ACP synthase III family protein [Streptacidiphilus sp. PB12-B1b]|uniref:3-oxoacyl-ACP synthase III family protein n=1 Tax=Streptacidiphilus sp. PB12-B1b TaxID=2705012 RepID=UPI0015FB117C|nr:3-oxoacyl-ACP synthase III family protein [Streptacidiphilus sp. PB12-B1b]QMU78140.1 3-oxoacyl-ACP synthase III family protein [Streptacidiphilus sp. PB12-B1b]